MSGLSFQWALTHLAAGNASAEGPPIVATSNILPFSRVIRRRTNRSVCLHLWRSGRGSPYTVTPDQSAVFVRQTSRRRCGGDRPAIRGNQKQLGLSLSELSVFRNSVFPFSVLRCLRQIIRAKPKMFNQLVFQCDQRPFHIVG